MEQQIYSISESKPKLGKEQLKLTSIQLRAGENEQDDKNGAVQRKREDSNEENNKKMSRRSQRCY